MAIRCLSRLQEHGGRIPFHVHQLGNLCCRLRARLFGEGAEPDKEEFDWVFSRFSDNDPGCILTMFVNNSNGDVRGALPLIDVPVLLTHGSLPSYCTKEIMEAIGGMIRDSRVEEFYGGHLHMLQDAEHFNRVLMDFLEKGNPR